MTADDFRRLALRFPEATESAHMGHPDFRVRGKIFATLWTDGEWGVVLLKPEEQARLLASDPGDLRSRERRLGNERWHAGAAGGGDGKEGAPRAGTGLAADRTSEARGRVGFDIRLARKSGGGTRPSRDRVSIHAYEAIRALSSPVLGAIFLSGPAARRKRWETKPDAAALLREMEKTYAAANLIQIRARRALPESPMARNV